MKRKIICIVSPTASGKTKLGVNLAKKFNGEIISADSRQVYRRLNLGTGKDLAEYGDIKYHLIDICEPGDKFTLFDWLELAHKAIEDVFLRGKTPIIVGGTFLYIKALLEGYKVKNNLQSGVGNFDREQLDLMEKEELIKILKKIAPKKLETIDQNNPRRLIRAIENAQSGSTPVRGKSDFEPLIISIENPREELYERIDQRVDSRFEEGMLEEVARLTESGVSTKWLLSLGLEYKIITGYLLGQKLKDPIYNSFEQMSQDLKYKTHAYARRQLTWLRKAPEIKFIKNQQEAEKLAGEFLKD